MTSSSREPAIRLPARVRALALSAAGGDRAGEEVAWLGHTGTVWRVSGESGVVYVKQAAKLRGEHDRLLWLAGRWPVPEVVGFLSQGGAEWLVTRQVPGVPLHERSSAVDPARAATLLGEILRGLHATGAAGCPFGKKRPGAVLIHGDYCLPNVLVSQGRLSGVIDVGRAGLGEPEVDLAAGVWTLQYNFGPGHARAFLDAYGATPMTDREIEKLRRRYGR